MSEGNWGTRLIKIIVLAVAALTAGAVLSFAVAVVAGLVAVCLIAFLTAYAVSPQDVRAILKLVTDRIDAGFEKVKEILAAMQAIVKTAADGARAAAGMSEADAAPERQEAGEQDKPAVKAAVKARKSAAEDDGA